jgi:hypothetical protein
MSVFLLDSFALPLPTHELCASVLKKDSKSLRHFDSKPVQPTGGSNEAAVVSRECFFPLSRLQPTMEPTNPLAFTKPQIKTILKEFLALFDDDEFKAKLAAVAPHEQQLQEVIESHQTKIMEKYGVDPKRGFIDIGRIRLVHQTDDELCDLVMVVATREEAALVEACGGASNPAGTVPPDFNLVSQYTQLAQDPQLMVQQAAMLQRLQSDPQLYAQFTQRMTAQLDANPHMRGQLVQLQQMMADQVQTMQQQTGSNLKGPGSEEME